MIGSQLSTNAQLVIGFPGSGKTTFLAALWHLVSSQEIETALSFKEFFGNDEYLNEITKKWIEYEQMERTPIGEFNDVSMRLTNPETEEAVDVSFSDLAGETFWQQWSERTCSKEYAELVSRSGGTILFVHPEKKHCPTSIAMTAKAKAAVASTVKKKKAKANETRKSIEWCPTNAGMQTAIVEVLQFINKLKTVPMFRVAVVVSAWDLLGKKPGEPEEWLAGEVPLLSQFLSANRNTMPSRIFGVSAQGAELNEARTNADKVTQPSERILITGSGVQKHDLTEIIKWVMVPSDD